MIYDVREGIVTIAGDGGQRIGIGTNPSAMRIDIGKACACAGVGTGTPTCRFEVRTDGAVGVKVVDLRRGSSRQGKTWRCR